MTNLTPIPDGTITAANQDHWQAAAESWLTAKEGRTGSQHTRRSYERALAEWGTFLASRGRHPKDAAGVDVTAWQQAMAETKSPSTIAQRLAAVSSFYLFVIKKFTIQDQGGNEIRLTDFNPIDRAERPKINAFAGAQKISTEDVSLILQQPDRDTIQGLRDYSILATFVLTGRRLSELARLRWRHLNFYNSGKRVTYTYTGKGKAGATNERQLPPAAWAAGTVGMPLFTNSSARRVAGSNSSCSIVTVPLLIEAP